MDILGGKVNILIGDVREKLRELPDDSVDCVVTSPPYWGLRDYGTGRWEEGDPTCDHLEVQAQDRPGRETPGGRGGSFPQSQRAYKAKCHKCGAVRIDSQIGLEPTLGEHLAVMVEVFREVRRVLKPTGTMWLNYGDCYATSPNGRSAADTKEAGNDDRTFRDKPFSTIGGFLKPKDLCMIPNRLAIALQEDGWWVRSEIIWKKPNPMPESTRDRPTSSHEKIWLMTKRERYFYDADAIAEPAVDSQREAQKTGSRPHKALYAVGPMARGNDGINHQFVDPERVWGGSGTRNSRNVWTIGTAAFSEAHFATFPPELAERCIKAGCPSDVCAKCGAPWVRDVEIESRPNAAVCNGKYDGVGKHRTVSGGVSNDARQRTHRGWKPSCSCESDTVSGSVLDPFGGAGTTGLVAASLGRTATLIELNPEYATLAQARIEAAFMGKEEGARHMVKQLNKAEEPGPLFAGL